MQSSHFSKRGKAYFFILVATLIWGAAGPIVKFTLDGVPPFPFLAYRFFIAGILGMFILLAGKIKIPKSRKLIFLSFIYGYLATTIALSALFIGLSLAGVLDLALMSTSGPILIMFGGWLFFRDHITKRELKGTLITITGTLIVVLGPVVIGSNTAKFTGNLFLLSFLFIDSACVLISKYLVKSKVSPFFLANLAFLVGAVTLIPLVVGHYGFYQLKEMFTGLELKYHLGVWYMAIFAGNIAYASLSRGVRSIEVSEAGLFAYLQPLVSAPLAVFWLGESIDIVFIIGAITIALGVYLAEKKSRKKKERSIV